jgi:site-specific recombinase XerD
MTVSINTAPISPLRQRMQHESGVRPTTINGTVSALRFLYTVTLKRQDLSRALVITRIVPRLPEVLSVEEAARLLQAAPGIKYKAVLGVAYSAGLRVPPGDAAGRDRRHRVAEQGAGL